jgi:hypothetical protein
MLGENGTGYKTNLFMVRLLEYAVSSFVWWDHRRSQCGILFPSEYDECVEYVSILEPIPVYPKATLPVCGEYDQERRSLEIACLLKSGDSLSYAGSGDQGVYHLFRAHTRSVPESNVDTVD